MGVSTVSLPRFAAVCFLATGLPFGVLMGVVCGKPELGVAAGAFFGVAMTLVLGGMHFAKARSDGGRVADVQQSDHFIVAGDVDRARAAAERALAGLGANKTRAESGDGRVSIECRTRMSLWSWGEIVRVELGPLVGDRVPVHVTSRPSWRTTIIDYGKNLANVRAFRAAMGG